MSKGFWMSVMLVAVVAGAFAALQGHETPAKPTGKSAVVLSEAQWKARLTSNQFNILRQAGTEPAFHNDFWNNHRAGTYICAGCGQELFSSKTKFESGTGWPSFYQPLAKSRVIERSDRSLGMLRIEVNCSRCGGHLGHVFDDGPKPTGLRYCMNSGAMKFIPAK